MDTDGRAPNRLIDEKSPYLLQHARNPVDWYPWGDEAFGRAKQEDKPVFLSIGYSTCHWCHVMERESFEDEEVARVLNRDYISIKVDREERPDLDAVYMAVCQALTGAGGWPLTLFLTPDKAPFFAATYLPKRRRYGSKGLLELLAEITKLWNGSRERLLRSSDEISAFVADQAQRTKDPAQPEESILKRAIDGFKGSFDAQNGGFGRAPKFPCPHNLIFLLQAAAVYEDVQARDAAEKTLQQMYRGGIFDQLGGGFSRYSTDSQWLAPHFEKMLYDNALMTLAYTEAFRQTGRELYRTAARRTVQYVLRELADEEGAFTCGQDADSEGEEGRYYAFTPREVKEALGEADGAALCAWLDITQQGNFEGKSIPNLLKNPSYESPDPKIERSAARLYEYRAKRMPLHRDGKILTAWNALMIAALARGSAVLGEEGWLDAARRAAHFLQRRLKTPDGRLFIRWRDGEAANEGILDDYAFYAWAHIELYLAAADPADLLEAIRAAEKMIVLFEDGGRGGFYLSAQDAQTPLCRIKELYDGAMPSGNSVCALVFVLLGRLTGEPVWQERAISQLSFLAGNITDAPSNHSFALLALLRECNPSIQIVCVTGQETAPLKELHALCNRCALPPLLWVKSRENCGLLGKAAPFTEHYPFPEQGVAYYFCRDGRCLAPVQDLSALEELLKQK